MSKLRFLCLFTWVGLLAGCASARASAGPPLHPGRPLPGLSQAQLKQFLRGQAKFARQYTPETGLGPLYNDNSCLACHSDFGSGGPSQRKTTLVGANLHGGPSLLVGFGGPVMQEHAVAGTPIEQVPKCATSLTYRITPQVWGLGLVEAVPDAAILALAAPDDQKRALGIRGIANFENGHLARFGLKAQKADLKVFTEQAYDWEMGLTTPDHLLEQRSNRAPVVTASPEVSRSEFNDVLAYERFLDGPPRGTVSSDARHGEEAFHQLGCAACHVSSLTTGTNRNGIPAGVAIAPYSDFLLHEMDEQLADQMTQGTATGAMWRTAPLWGLRFRSRYMHDGRAATLDDAILAHGGEAARVRDRYQALSPEEQQALQAFLASL